MAAISIILWIIKKSLESRVATYVCKVCILYKKKVRGEEKSLGTKNMLDHLGMLAGSCKCLFIQPGHIWVYYLGYWVIRVSGTDPVSTLEDTQYNFYTQQSRKFYRLRDYIFMQKQ